MRLRLATLAALVATPLYAADMPQRILPPKPAKAPAPLVVAIPSELCVTANPVEIFIEPEGRSNGILPAGMQVHVVDFPFARFRDLWVRVKPPREDLYYGWVHTRDLACL